MSERSASCSDFLSKATPDGVDGVAGVVGVAAGTGVATAAVVAVGAEEARGVTPKVAMRLAVAATVSTAGGGADCKAVNACWTASCMAIRSGAS